MHACMTCKQALDAVQVECDDGAGGEFSLVYTGPETGLEAEGLEVRL